MSRVPHSAHGFELESEELRLADIAKRPPHADHRVRLLGLELVTALQASELVGAEVDRPVRDRSRREGTGKGRQAVAHPLDELGASPLVEEEAGVLSLERLDHHQLGSE